ncbi:MAG: type II toxin-antitoxin system PemK/MazF family toxin [Chloroflexota bacterium]|nr:type II toxin-antitoxin system PemK/MazF family toxin [Chloroflexota bacterium]
MAGIGIDQRGDFQPEGSEQQGVRPVVVVSRQAINGSSQVVIVVPCTTYRPQRRVYPSQVVVRAPEGGLTVDSVALCEQVRALSIDRIIARRGQLRVATMHEVDDALRNALELDA